MTSPQPIATPAEYLAMDAASREKFEYVDGRIYAMAGASLTHIQIVGNVWAALKAQLRGRDCRAYASELRVKVRPTGAYVYPDLVALCGRPEVENTKPQTLLNPSLVVEVLSDSTEGYDRGDKFAQYARLPSLREYVLISQTEPRVERFVPSGRDWTLTAVADLDGSVDLPSVGAALRLREVYEDVEFPEEPPRRPRLVREVARELAGLTTPAAAVR